MKFSLTSFFTLLFLLPIQNTYAIEILSAKELTSHCALYAKNKVSVDGEFCARYIQGFIDGAVATDARVMLNTEEELKQQGTFHERVMRTRSPSRDEYFRAARYAEFCLGDPVLLKEVVSHVVADLNQLGKNLDESLSARDVVYNSLKKRYPCKAVDAE